MSNSIFIEPKLITFPDFSVAQRIKQLSLGVDANAVKASGLALSIGLEDRFKVINTKQGAKNLRNFLCLFSRTVKIWIIAA